MEKKWCFSTVYIVAGVAENWDGMSLPWLLASYFKSIKSLDETTSVSDYTFCRFVQFVSWINDMQLVDLGFVGPPFTWARGNDRKT